LCIGCEQTGRVLLWDLALDKEQKSVATQGHPSRIYLGQDNQSLCVLCSREKQMLVYSLPGLKLLAVFSLPAEPSAWVRNLVTQQDYFSSQASNGVYPYIGKNPLPMIETGRAPVDLLVRPDADQLWIADYHQSCLTVVGLAKGDVVKQVPVWPNPRKLLPATYGDRIYALCIGEDAVPAKSVIQLVDVNYQKAGLSWPAGAKARDFIFDARGNHLLVAGQEGILIVSQATGALIETLATGKNPTALAVAPDNARLYAACPEEKAVFVHKLDPEVMAKE
jgi:hypothetical protein